MQALDDNFCYSNSGIINGGLQKERQLMVEEQKLCRARARKFFLETNRRRKALEERRKLWDVQEQRLRENVLQQRRLRVQEATERFQRAHLPPSQRRRQSFKRNVPSLEDALNHIQGSLISDQQQSSFVSISSFCRSRTPSPKASTKPKPSPHLALSAVEAYTKLLQERSIVSFRNNQESHEPQEKQVSSPQEDSLSDCLHSERISSKDSLDFEEPKHGTKNLHSSPFLLDTDMCLSDPKKHIKQSSYLSDMLLTDTLTQSRRLLELNQKKQADPKIFISKNNITKCSWGITTNEKAPNTEKHNSFTNKESDGTDPYDIAPGEPSTNDNPIVLNSNKELDTPSPKHELALDLRQPKANDERQLKHPSATEIILPITKNGNSTDYLFGASGPNIFLNNCTMDNTCQEGTLEQAGKDQLYASSRKELSASINNLNKISDVANKTEKKRLNTELRHKTCLNCNQSKNPVCLKCSEREEPLSPVSLENPKEVRFIKGILKKQSKYMSGNAACACNPGHVTLTKQVALAIRDSVELTRAKNKDLESNSAVKKKLRWFDEVHMDSEDKAQNIIKQIKNKSSSLLHSKHTSEDHQPSLTSVLGAIRPGPSMTHTIPNGYHFTRQAWADVGVQVSLAHQQGDEVKAPPRNNKTSGPKAGSKERTESAPVSSRTRKGTNMRPQSATEVSQIARAHGRLVMPRPPPPRMDAIEEQKVFVSTTPYGACHASVNCKPAADHGVQREGPETVRTEIRTDSGAFYVPHRPTHACPVSESNTKSHKPKSSHHQTEVCSKITGIGNHEKALRLNCTPTEEEISQLWHGVRAALATKDAQAGVRRQAVKSTQVARKTSATLGIRRLPQTTQTSDLCRPFSVTHDLTFPEEDLHRFFHSNHDEIHNYARQNWAEIAEPRRPETLQRQQPQRHQGFTSLSMEEEKILLSLDRLNHRLQYMHEHQNTGNLTGLEVQSTTDLTAMHSQNLQAVSLCSGYQKKI